MSRAYTPTAGMLAYLVDAPPFTPLDALRCRLRGLVDHDDRVTPAGQGCIHRELQRRKELGRG